MTWAYHIPWLTVLVKKQKNRTYLLRCQWWLWRRRIWLVKSMRPSLPMPFETSLPMSASAALNGNQGLWQPHDPCWPATERGTGLQPWREGGERGRGSGAALTLRSRWTDSSQDRQQLWNICMPEQKTVKGWRVCISGPMRANAP